MVTQGLWINFDGHDYGGKRMQIARLFDTLTDWSEDNIVVTTHEPTRRAAEIKQTLVGDPDPYTNGMQLTNLYTDDRVWDETSIIYPILSIGGIVLSNRHKHATDAFQSAQRVPIEVTIAMQKRKKIGTPDLTFFLLASRKTIAERMQRKGRALDKFERDLDFQMKVSGQYRLIARMASSDPAYFGNIHIINANPSADVVARNITAIVKPVYDKWLAELSYQNP